MSAPSVVIQLPLEGPVVVRMDALTEAEQVRLLDWLNNGHPDYAELVARALELARRERAA